MFKRKSATHISVSEVGQNFLAIKTYTEFFHFQTCNRTHTKKRTMKVELDERHSEVDSLQTRPSNMVLMEETKDHLLDRCSRMFFPFSYSIFLIVYFAYYLGSHHHDQSNLFKFVLRFYRWQFPSVQLADASEIQFYEKI